MFHKVLLIYWLFFEGLRILSITQTGNFLGYFKASPWKAIQLDPVTWHTKFTFLSWLPYPQTLMKWHLWNSKWIKPQKTTDRKRANLKEKQENTKWKDREQEEIPRTMVNRNPRKQLFKIPIKVLVQTGSRKQKELWAWVTGGDE